MCSPGTAQPLAQDPAGRDPSVGDETPLPGGDATSCERAHVPAHLRHQPAEAAGGSQRRWARQCHCRQPRPGENKSSLSVRFSSRG